jgi:uncharacterized protein YkwD
MRKVAVLCALSVLCLGLASNAIASSHGHESAARTVLSERVSALARKSASAPAPSTRPASPAKLLSALESDIVARINAQRGVRGMRPLRVSRGLTAAANYHTHQMGLLGFFEHESRNGAPFWKRLERFYPAGRGYWSVGENIFYESPDTTAASAVHEWMHSPPHRQNILTREWREIGVAAVHFPAAPGAFGGKAVTIVTADFGVRR